MAAKEELKLLGVDVSPFAIRAHMAVVIKGVSCEYVVEDLSNKSELLLSSNPVYKKVPVLIHNGKPICESLVIVQYVDEIFSGDGVPSILPTDPYERAIARFWAAYVDDKFFPVLRGIVLALTEQERVEKATETLAAIEPLEEAFAMCSKGKAFFSGDSIGYVDLALGSLLVWIEAIRRMYNIEIISASKTPRLSAWAERFGESAAAKEVLPEVDKAVQFGKMLEAAASAAAASK
ncbi:hypothetical protein PR202_ga07659 [Eleusine coracana subsp. coracana]|uniref:Glutathione S-transferase n=1 Tax=Eleusine coracana subsp. coracana TaxID=191504 RepID=A0AAV5BZ95_ELECO|nr:hypothetical protein QOZ80_2AG0114640 [Eleusine coracana subsp. coracana]GJM91297.1 hypothetical protein PR202_ga07659 [Eleusine coracana subsp. coracana]